jgi:nucleotide-binding universal stress UspA family protein
MPANSKVLLTLDDSAATWKAAEYVGDLVRTTPELSICLVHAADPMPPELQEFRGAEDPQREKVLEYQLKEKQNRWEREARKAAAPLIDKARFLLQQAGVEQDRIESRVLVLMHREDLVDEIIKTAREFGCDTIVTGRNAFPWMKELFVDHLGDEISRRAKGIIVNVV